MILAQFEKTYAARASLWHPRQHMVRTVETQWKSMPNSMHWFSLFQPAIHRWTIHFQWCSNNWVQWVWQWVSVSFSDFRKLGAVTLAVRFSDVRNTKCSEFGSGFQWFSKLGAVTLVVGFSDFRKTRCIEFGSAFQWFSKLHSTALCTAQHSTMHTHYATTAPSSCSSQALGRRVPKTHRRCPPR